LDAEQTSQHPRVPTFSKLENLKVSSTIDHLLRAVDACSTTEEIRDHAVEREPGNPTGGAVERLLSSDILLSLFFCGRDKEIGRLEFDLGAFSVLCFKNRVSYLKLWFFPWRFWGAMARTFRHFWLLRYAGHETEMWFQLLCALARDGVISTTYRTYRTYRFTAVHWGKLVPVFGGMNKMD